MGRGYGGGGRGRLYTYRYTVTTRMISALRWAAMRAILMFPNCEGQSHKTVSTDHNLWRKRRAEADLNRGPSPYQPNALPLGQTGSRRQNEQLNIFRRLRCGRWHRSMHICVHCVSFLRFTFYTPCTRPAWCRRGREGVSEREGEERQGRDWKGGERVK